MVSPKKQDIIYEQVSKQSKHKTRSHKREYETLTLEKSSRPSLEIKRTQPTVKQYVIRFQNSGAPVHELRDNKSANTDEINSVSSMGKINLSSINFPGKSKFHNTPRNNSFLESHAKYFTSKNSSFNVQKTHENKAYLQSYYDQFQTQKQRRTLAVKKTTSPIRLQMDSRSATGTAN